MDWSVHSFIANSLIHPLGLRGGFTRDSSDQQTHSCHHEYVMQPSPEMLLTSHSYDIRSI